MRPVSSSAMAGPTRRLARLQSAGQMLVLFVMSIFVLTGITAVVVDISWYWANTLRVQRAADAAALAGVVWLPGAPTTAYSTARTEATKNGYTDGAGGVTVFPIQDSGNDRRLDVTISAPVDTFFMKIFGIQTIRAVRTSKADFILPVPMGSPEQWYGIGNYEVFSPGPPHVRGPQVPTNTAGPNNWTAAANGLTNNNTYATSGNTTSMQGYRDFGLNVPGADTINGIQIRVDAKSTDSPRLPARGLAVLGQRHELVVRTVRRPHCIGSDVTVPGRRWTVARSGLDTPGSRPTSATPTSASASAATTPGPTSRLRPTAGAGATTSLDFLDVTVYSTGAGTSAATNVPTPSGESVAPTTQGFWGAIFTRGGVRRNGDRYSPEHFDPGIPNAEYLPAGYDYTIEFGVGGGRVNLFDPVFCATGANASGSWYGAGDHWTTQSSSNSTPDPGGPVTTVFTLYDQGATPVRPDRRRRRRPARRRQPAPGRPERPGRQPECRSRGPARLRRRSASQPVGPPGCLDDARPVLAARRPLPAQRRHEPGGQRRHGRREHVVDLRRRQRPGRQRPGLRRRPDGRLQQHHLDERLPALLPRPGRGGPRRQDDGHRAVRPGRRRPERLDPGPEPRQQRLQLRDVRLHLRLGLRERSQR